MKETKKKETKKQRNKEKGDEILMKRMKEREKETKKTNGRNKYSKEKTLDARKNKKGRKNKG